MVAHEHDDRRVRQPKRIERFHQQPDLDIDQRDGCVVGSDGLTLLLVAVVGILGVAADGGCRDVGAVIRGLDRQHDLGDRVLFEERCRRDPRLVGLVESGSYEERPVAVRPHEFDHPPGGLSVGRLGLGLVRGAPGQRHASWTTEVPEDLPSRKALLGSLDP